MKRFDFLIVGLVLAFLFPPVVTSGALDSWYTDIPDHQAYYDGIYYMTQADWVSGYEDGTFRPEDEVSRVEALKMILEVAGVVNMDISDNIVTPLPVADFSDTEAGVWYEDYIKKAFELGIISGYSDGTFKPEANVNRAEALKMLLIATDTEDTAGIDPWYLPYMEYAEEHVLIWPDASGDYIPDHALTRGELADLIYRFKKEPYTDTVEYGIASYYGYSFDGHNTASGTPLDAEGFMAAHKTLPFGTVLRITRLDTLQAVEVTVVDRGPYTEGYIVDLTPAAFEQIGSLSTGIVKVRLEVLKQ